MAATTAGDGGDASEPWWRRKRPRRPPPPPEADAEAVKAEALELMAAFPVLPRLVVFDLDYTLWPFQCDRLPKDEIPYLYPQARGILNALRDKGVEMAIASRASRRGVAKTFLEKLGIQFIFGAQTNKLGVCCVRVEKGVTLEKLRMGLGNYAKSVAIPKAEQTQMGLKSFFKTSAASKTEETES
ncbi:hypothetical protein EJB05_28121, partial [Eragrostis curvula]